jgi:hypothetical protein
MLNRRSIQLPFLFLSILMVAALLFTACGGVTPPATTTAAAKYTWPKSYFISAVGQSGQAKTVSWVAVFEGSTGVAARVVPDAANIKCIQKIKGGETNLMGIDRNELRNNLEALEDWASKDMGPWPVRIVWVHDLAHAGFFVRGDSPITYPSDIKKGARIAVWNMQASTLNPPRGLIAWAGLTEKDIVWVDTGTTEGVVRAVKDGRADLAFGWPTSPGMLEISSSPQGVKWVNMDASKDPQGASRFQQVNPLYAFAPMAYEIKEVKGVWGTAGYMHEIVRAGDDEFIYNLAKWFDANYNNIKDKYESNRYMSLEYLMDSLKSTYIPVHDGLIRYLKEKGLWTAAHDARQKVNLELLQKYIDAYPKAVAAAEQKGLKVEPGNYEWQKFWTDYKIQNNINKFVMHPSLEVNGPVIKAEQVPPPQAAPAPLAPTPTATTPVAPAGLDFKFVSVPVKVTGGDKMTVIGQTAPGAECTIRFIYKSGSSSTLVFTTPTQKAGADGKVQWEGTTSARGAQGAPGTTTLEVDVKSGDKTGTFKTTFELVAP